MNIKLWIAILLAIVLVTFTAQNYQVVELRFLVWKLEMSRAVMIIGVFVSGVIAGALTTSLRKPDAPPTRSGG